MSAITGTKGLLYATTIVDLETGESIAVKDIIDGGGSSSGIEMPGFLMNEMVEITSETSKDVDLTPFGVTINMPITLVSLFGSGMDTLEANYNPSAATITITPPSKGYYILIFFCMELNGHFAIPVHAI